ncbi:MULTISPECIES: P-loop NTPase fold protein [unclassified Streptomyces]|uniref:P-loop NTPase fold protein n=1 Tax=unclassified Streptomyces TaxID=2593676 RepID=UPI003820A485
MSNGGYHWRYGERAVYEQAVRACLGDRRLRELLRRRPYVTEESVVDAMCAAPVVARVLEGAPSRVGHRLLRLAGHLHDVSLPGQLPVGERVHRLWFAFMVALFAGSLDGGASALSALVIALTPALLIAAYTLVRRTASTVLTRVRPSWWKTYAVVTLLVPLSVLLHVVDRLGAALWLRELRRTTLADEVSRAVENLLGDDRGTLLFTSGDGGLRAPREPSYFVPNVAAERLARKIAQLDGGVIAVSGPRGVGKTSLVKECVREKDFGVLAPAPGTYTPQEFLTSLFVTVCRRYIERADFQAPELVRLSFTRRAARTLSRPLRVLRHTLYFAVPSAVLLGVGLYASARSLERDRLPWGQRQAAELADSWGDFTGKVLGGTAPGTALALTAFGVTLWFLRNSRGFSRGLRAVAVVIRWLLLAALLIGPVVSLFVDEQLRAHVSALNTIWFVGLSALWLTSGYLLAASAADASPTRWWFMNRTTVFSLLTSSLPLLILALAVADERTRPLLTDPDHPLRLGVFVLGLVLLKPTGKPRSFLRPAPRLVADCRDHLYRLQTVQSSSAALTSGAAQVLTLGTAHATTLTSAPLNYPSLADDFRELLTRIAEYEYRHGHRVVIVIDELDRLGSDTKALAFLAEVKAILGVPHVHYLVSVAEDVGAAFVRRGLPYRDVTDSSLDDVLHVRPGTAADAVRMLGVRAPGIGEPYVLLAHALSGGLPRDLVRYARRLLEIKAATEQVELPDVAGLLILEELAETLAGFRTLLAKQPWTAGDPDVLGLFRDAAAHLRTACPCTLPMRALRPALLRLAVPDTTGLAEEPLRLVDEAAAYVSLALTLLDVFGSPDFNRRRADAEAASPDGGPDALAEARQELALSPYTARTVIDAVRRAWGLAPLAAPAAAVPPQRRPPCARHPRRTAPVG